MAAEVTYVSNLAVTGFLNGVVNLCFTTAQFVPVVVPAKPGEEGPTVIVDVRDEVSANLRLDLNVAQQLHAALGKIIDENTKLSGPAN